MKRLRYMVVPISLLVSLVVCTHAPTSGGSSDSGNIKFAGIIYNDSGSVVTGAEVTLCPADYAGGLDEENAEEDNRTIRHTVTDQNGRFEFNEVNTGNYLIEANDRVAHAVAFEAIADEDGSPESYCATLKHYSVFKGRTKEITSSSAKRHLFIYGLDRKVAVDQNGYFTVPDMPEGDFNGFIRSEDSTVETIEIENITVTAGDTVTIGPVGWEYALRVLINTSATGADVGNDIADFPLLLRLNEGDVDFTEAQTIPRSFHIVDMNNSELRFSVEEWDGNRRQAALWVLLDTVYGNNSSQFITLLWDETATENAGTDGNVYDTTLGFQGVWHLSDKTIDSVEDATLNGFHGVCGGMNDESIVDGIIGKAREFNGVSSFIGIPNSAEGKLDFDEGGQYTISVWVYADHPELGSQAIFSKGDEQYFLCSVEGSDAGPFWRFTEFKDEVGWEYSSANAVQKEWVYLTAVKNGAGQYLYLNGEPVDSVVTLVASTKSRLTELEVAIGKFMEENGGAGDAYFNGKIDEVRVANVVRSADWVRLCYMNQRTDDRLTIIQKVK